MKKNGEDRANIGKTGTSVWDYRSVISNGSGKWSQTENCNTNWKGTPDTSWSIVLLKVELNVSSRLLVLLVRIDLLVRVAEERVNQLVGTLVDLNVLAVLQLLQHI